MIGAVLAFPMPVPRGAWWLVGASLAWSGLIALSAALGRPVAVRVSTLCGLGMTLRLSVPELWPGLVPLVAAIAVSAFLAWAFRWPGPLADLPMGSFDRRTRWMVAGVVALAVGGLAGWIAAVGPHGYLEGTRLAIRHARSAPIWTVAPIGLLFALVNAAAEEAFFRGAFMAGLIESVAVPVAVLVQAASFGILHLRGFPSGPAGVALAAAYGLLLGLLRIRARGLLAPWVAHALTDIAIISVIVWVAR